MQVHGLFMYQYKPFGLSVEQRTARMNVDGLSIDERTVTFLWIFFGRITEESRANGFLYASCVFTS